MGFSVSISYFGSVLHFLTPPEVDNAQKMQKYCIQEMKKDGINGLFAWLATRSIPKLERWKKKAYQKK
ncbi:MAG: hypothetical protein KJ771_04075 [Nanoarchaeota archaeon]|nr:hypothetical protein [Nanoarchaeota archaeon]